LEIFNEQILPGLSKFLPKLSTSSFIFLSAEPALRGRKSQDLQCWRSQRQGRWEFGITFLTQLGKGIPATTGKHKDLRIFFFQL
jgi:hypothetical protein